MTTRTTTRRALAALAALAVLAPTGPATAQEPGAAPYTGPTEVRLAATASTYGSTTQPIAVQGAANADVRLYGSTAPLQVFKVIRTGRTDERGSIGFTIAPGATTRLYAEVGGVRTAVRTVTVHRAVHLDTVRLQDDARDLYTFTGRVAPARSEPDGPARPLGVTLAKVLSDGRVVGVASTVAGRDGSWAITPRLSPGTNLYYVLVGATGSYGSGRSRLYGLAVR